MMPGGRRRLPGIVAMVALATLFAVGCGRADSAGTFNRDGNNAYRRGDYQKALDEYRRAQVLRPDLPALNYNAANALYQQGDYIRAVTDAQQAAQAPNSDDALRAHAFYTLGADYYRQGKLSDALTAFKNALRIDPSDTDAKYNIEVIQRQLDREAQARQNLPTPTPEPTRPAGQRGNSQGQQGGAQQGTQPGGQQGDQGGSPGQNQGGQNAAPNQGGSQPGGQPNGGNPAPGTGGSTGGPGPGATGTPQPSLRAQQQQADRNVQDAIQAYKQSGSIDDALRILDALAQAQAIAQAAQSNQLNPSTRDK
jgi:Ca-activated chloride channel family protein